MNKLNATPPKNTRWIMGNHDLPQNYGLGSFQVRNALGRIRVITLQKRIRQILEALMLGPVYCASTVRVGHYVDLLRDEQNVNIETLWFSDNKGPIKTRYGVYVLRDAVTLLPEGDAA